MTGLIEHAKHPYLYPSRNVRYNDRSYVNVNIPGLSGLKRPFAQTQRSIVSFVPLQTKLIVADSDSARFAEASYCMFGKILSKRLEEISPTFSLHKRTNTVYYGSRSTLNSSRTKHICQFC